MAGKKNNAVVSVISGLTKTQAAQITKDIMKAKAKHAPCSRGTAASGIMENVGNLLQNGIRKAIKG